jgi:hypothetical protein
MLNLAALLGIAPSSKKEAREQKVNPPSYSIMVDMRRRVNAQEPFTLVHLQLERRDGNVVGDVKYISDLVGGTVLSSKSVGVIVPLGQYQQVYDKLEELAQAPFASDVRVGYGSFPGKSEEIHAIGNILAEAQRYRTHRKYIGKQLEQAVSGEKVLECA